jgi:hypothetical protein
MANVVVSAIATFNGKALKKGQKELSAFDKQAQKLGKTFNRVFATTALVAFSKKAINAFAADEKAAKSLAVQLENTGNAFRVNEVESYIAGLQSLYGVLDDQLRPAFQTLLNATGSVTLSQQALETALNVSAGTGKDLATVVAAIAKGASGTTTSIARLGTGLDKATIATGDMNSIMEALDAKFKGQALARLDTYAGKMDVLKVNAGNATEIIGKGLIDALMIIGKDNSIQGAADSMNSFALAIADTIRGLGTLVGEVKKFMETDVGKLLSALAFLVFGSKKLIIGGALALIGYDIGKTNAPGKPNVGGYSGIPLQKAENKAIKDAVTYRKQENALIKAKTAVDQLRDKFDLERIGLAAALNAATDEETKLRIKAQIAILDNNEALAKKILAEMEATNKLKEFTDALAASTNKYDAMISGLIGQFRTLGLSLQESMALAGMSARYQAQADAFAAGRGGGSGGGAAPLSTDPYDVLIRQLAPQLNTQYGLPAQEAISLATMSARYQAQADAITINIQAGGDKMSQAIAESIQIANRNGYDLTGAGQLP